MGYTGLAHIWYDKTGRIRTMRGILDDAPPALRVTPEGTPNWQVITTQVSEDDYPTLMETHYVDPHSKKLVRK